MCTSTLTNIIIGFVEKWHARGGKAGLGRVVCEPVETIYGFDSGGIDAALLDPSFDDCTHLYIYYNTRNAVGEMRQGLKRVPLFLTPTQPNPTRPEQLLYSREKEKTHGVAYNLCTYIAAVAKTYSSPIYFREIDFESSPFGYD